MPNLFEGDTYEQVQTGCRGEAGKNNINPADRDAVYYFFINRVRSKLHLCICMSPVGEAFRSVLNMIRTYGTLLRLRDVATNVQNNSMCSGTLSIKPWYLCPYVCIKIILIMSWIVLKIILHNLYVFSGHICYCFCRRRCRMFPSLVNCCTIDWFTKWPPEALLSVAEQCLLPMGDKNIIEKISRLCVTMHQVSVTIFPKKSQSNHIKIWSLVRQQTGQTVLKLCYHT